MASKGLAFMVGALVVLAVPAIVHYTKDRGRWQADADASAGQSALPALDGLADSAVQAIEIVDRDGTLRIVRSGTAWVLANSSDFPARPDAVADFLRGLQTLRLVEASTSDPAKHARIGLVAPADGGEESALARVLGANGQVLAELLLGREDFGRSGSTLFVRRPDESQAWLARGSVPHATSPSAWWDNRIAAVPSTRVRRAEVAFPEAGDAGYALERASPQDFGFQFSPRPEDRELVEEWRHTALARAFSALTLEDVARAEALDTAGAERALVQVATHDGLRLEIDARRLPSAIEGTPGPVWVSVAARVEPAAAGPLADGELPPDPAVVEREAAEIAARASGWWFKVSAGTGATLFTKRDELLKPLPPLPALPEVVGEDQSDAAPTDATAADGDAPAPSSEEPPPSEPVESPSEPAESPVAPEPAGGGSDEPSAGGAPSTPPA